MENIYETFPVGANKLEYVVNRLGLFVNLLEYVVNSLEYVINSVEYVVNWFIYFSQIFSTLAFPEPVPEIIVRFNEYTEKVSESNFFGLSRK